MQELREYYNFYGKISFIQLGNNRGNLSKSTSLVVDLTSKVGVRVDESFQMVHALTKVDN